MWARIFAIDLRSVRLFRVLLGIVVVANGIYCLPRAEAIGRNAPSYVTFPT
jgi:hypothetical protein